MTHLNDLVRSLELLRLIVNEKIQLIDDRGVCPFHDEKTASFGIFQAASGRARFHCFGCEIGGDVIDFLRRSHRISFTSAVRKLSSYTLDKIETAAPELLPAERLSAARKGADIGDEIYCEKDCKRYANLREDYEALLSEIWELKDKLNVEQAPAAPENSSILVAILMERNRCLRILKTNPTIDSTTHAFYIEHAELFPSIEADWPEFGQIKR